MLKGCGHDIGGYRDVHWNFYCDAIQRLKKTPTEQVEAPLRDGPATQDAL